MKRLLAGLILLAACARPAPPAIAPAPIVMIRAALLLRPLVVINLPAPVARSVRLCAGGDVMLGSDLDTTWAAVRGVPALPNPLELVKPLRPLVADADIVLVNVEGAIGQGDVPRKCRPRSTTCYAFRQPPRAASALRALLASGAIVGNVANNHAMDAGPEGFAQTVEQLELAGVFPTGADSTPTIVALPGGDTLAFLGFSTFQAGPDARDLEAVTRYVSRSAARWRTVVTWHNGAEGVGAQRTPDHVEHYLGENRGNPVAFAHAAVAAGAIAVIGHGPHVLRGAQWFEGRPVIYSLGNLLTYGPFSTAEPLNHGGFACLVIDPQGRTLAAEFRSTVQVTAGVVRPDSNARAAALVDSLSQLDFPSSALLH